MSEGNAVQSDGKWVLEALDQYEAKLLRFARSIVGEAQAADVVQDTFLRLCKQPERDVRGHLAAWLFTVCRNRALSQLRSERRLQNMEDEDVQPHPDSGPASKLERKEQLTRVGRAIRELPERQREALLLKLDGGLSYKEIAEVMQLSVSNVGFILHQAVQAIRNEIASESALPAVARRMS